MPPIHGVAFDATATYVLGAQNDDRISVWDVASGERRFELGGHDGPVRAIASSTRDRTIATGSLDGAIMLWDLDSGDYQPHFARMAQGVLALAFSPDARRLAATSEDGAVAIFDVATRAQVLALQRPASVMSVAWRSDGGAFVTGSFDRTCCTWDLAGTCIAERRPIWGPVFGVTCAANGALAMACSRAAELVDPSGDTIAIRAEHGMCHAVAFAARDALVLGTGPAIVIAEPGGDGATRRTLNGHTELVSSFSVATGGTLLASGSEDGTVRIWDLAAPGVSPIRTLLAP